MMEVRHTGKLILALSIIWFIVCACSINEVVTPAPIILVNSHDPQQWDGWISGSVEGADPRHYFIAIYKQVNDEWYSVPGHESAEINILEDRTWFCPTDSRDVKTADAIQIFLLPRGFELPILRGENVLPLKLHLAAASKVALELISAAPTIL